METDYYTNESTRGTNLQQIPLIFRAIKGGMLWDWLKKSTELLHAIKQLQMTSEKGKGTPYALTAFPRIIGCILNIIKYMKLPMTKENDKILFDGYRIAKLACELQLYNKKHPQLNPLTAVKNYDSIITGIAKKGKQSLPYLVAMLYKYAPLRNDFSNMILIQNKNDIEPNKNYMILPDKGKANICIQKHKTIKTSGIINVEFPEDVSTMLRAYVKKEKILPNGKLFKDLTPVLYEITQDNNADKVDGGTRLIRRCSASTLYDQYVKGKATPTDIYRQMNIMAHSSNTHMNDYIYGIVK
jgi:hypothetical protein